jgi:gluconokinase
MIVVIMGVSGSGKTTVGRLLAQCLEWTYHEGDDFHSADNVEKMSKGIALTDEDRTPWLASIKKVIDESCEYGLDAVIACSALRSKYRSYLADRVSEIHFVYLKGDISIIRERMKFRERHYMGVDMLESQFASLEEPADAIVVDIRESPEDIVSHIEREAGVGAKSHR